MSDLPVGLPGESKGEGLGDSYPSPSATTESGSQNQLPGFWTKWRVLRLRWQAASEVTGLGCHKRQQFGSDRQMSLHPVACVSSGKYVPEFVQAAK